MCLRIISCMYSITSPKVICFLHQVVHAICISNLARKDQIKARNSYTILSWWGHGITVIAFCTCVNCYYLYIREEMAIYCWVSDMLWFPPALLWCQPELDQLCPSSQIDHAKWNRPSTTPKEDRIVKKKPNQESVMPHSKTNIVTHSPSLLITLHLTQVIYLHIYI